MKERINSVVEMGKVPKEIRDQNKGFSEWDNGVTKQNHQSIVKVNLLHFLSTYKPLQKILYSFCFWYYFLLAR